MRRFAVLVLLVVVALALAPGTARAQRYFGGFAGYPYDGGVAGCPSIWDDCPNRHTGYGIVAGAFSGGIFGVEQEYGWTSGFFGEGGQVTESKVTTLMTNFLVAVPIGPLRPYGTFGLGFTKASIDFAAADLSDFSDTAFSRNYGVGVMVLLPAHFGIRLDYRRFRSGPEIPTAAGGDNELRFSRVSVGVVLH